MATRKKNGYKYKNLTLAAISLVLSFLLFTNESFHDALLHLGRLEYVGALVAGFFWVSTFTIAPASIVLFILTESLPAWTVALIAGVGAVIGDAVIFRFVRNTDIAREMLDVFRKLGGKKLTHLLHSRHIRWTWPFIGALIIISPLPDELGVSLMGISKLKTGTFLLVSYVLNTIGILMLLSASVFIKP